MPHQKVVVIDSMIAFEGSANLTLQGWRKAAEGLDRVVTVRDPQQIATLNNKYFSPVWDRWCRLRVSPEELDRPW
jgi:phosphatidylserine/phosphatidylglycerophosphate/cardiolipin synthase-like enzyme